jgi:hypothetical protein
MYSTINDAVAASIQGFVEFWIKQWQNQSIKPWRILTLVWQQL